VPKTGRKSRVARCDLHWSRLPSANITYTLKNNNSTDETHWIHLVINDSSGSQAGTGSDLVDISGVQSATKQTTVYLDAFGNVT
jgi:hypothetical protein